MSVPKLQHVSTQEWLDIGLAAGAQGGALYTAGSAESSALVRVGAPVLDVGRFAVRGMPGSFLELHGARGRRIDWWGALRATTAAMTAIVAQRDAWELREGRLKFVDRDGTEYDNCWLARFELIGELRPIVSHAVLDWFVRYEIEIEQLEV